jgi:2'-5' RNA ligase
LDEALSVLGMEKENKRFKAHLTLARIKGSVRPEVIVDAVSRHGSRSSRGFAADRIFLIKSELYPGGPQYSDLFCAPMGVS